MPTPIGWAHPVVGAVSSEVHFRPKADICDPHRSILGQPNAFRNGLEENQGAAGGRIFKIWITRHEKKAQIVSGLLARYPQPKGLARRAARNLDAVQKRMVVGMITLEDCVAFCGLTEEEVLAIAEHEHIPEIAAAALAEYLMDQERGTEKIRDMIVDDIRASQARNDRQHVLTLLHVLHHFLRTHVEARPEQHPWSGRFWP